jgi:hypothetical protein
LQSESRIKSILDSLCKTLPIKGSCNFQAIVKQNGEVIPFEFNGRISGSNPVRACLGFPDTIWLVNEWILGIKPPSFVVTPCLTLLSSNDFLVVPIDQENSLTKTTQYIRTF